MSFYDALENNEVARVDEYIRNGADVNEKGGIELWPPLYYAVYYKSFECVRLLLDAKASAGPCDALSCAIRNYDLKMIQLLLDNKADVLAPNQYSNDTPLHTATRIGKSSILELLLPTIGERSVDVCNTAGITPLAMAIRKEYLHCQKLLVKAGAKMSNVRLGFSKCQRQLLLRRHKIAQVLVVFFRLGRRVFGRDVTGLIAKLVWEMANEEEEEVLENKKQRN